MRILLVSHGLPPDSVGGVEQHVDGLARALVAAGHDVEIFAREGAAGPAEGSVRAVSNGNPRIARVTYRWQHVPDLQAMYTSPGMAEALRRFVRERAAAGARFDVAHVHHLTGMSTDSLAELAAAGVPTVLTLHDYWLFCPRGQMFHVREEACTAASVARCSECLAATFPGWVNAADGEAQVPAVHARALQALALPQVLVVPNARAIAPFAELGVPASRFVVVENGVDTERLLALPPPGLGPGPLRVGYLGTVMPSKGLHVLLDAIARLPAGKVSLRIHGNVVPYHGDASYATRCFAKLRPQDDVVYHGPYGLDALPRLMAELDVVAAPALWHEAFGLTVREALAASRPVLVSAVGGLQDAVVDGEHGRVLPPGDAAAWAAVLGGWADDRATVRRLALRARSRARGFAPMAADLVGVYREAIARSAAAAGDLAATPLRRT